LGGKKERDCGGDKKRGEREKVSPIRVCPGAGHRGGGINLRQTRGNGLKRKKGKSVGFRARPDASAPTQTNVESITKGQTWGERGSKTLKEKKGNSFPEQGGGNNACERKFLFDKRVITTRTTREGGGKQKGKKKNNQTSEPLAASPPPLGTIEENPSNLKNFWGKQKTKRIKKKGGYKS